MSRSPAGEATITLLTKTRNDRLNKDWVPYNGLLKQVCADLLNPQI